MNSLPAGEIKRRGVQAIEEKLAYGPVHIIKHNRPSCVVLSEEEYQALSKPQNSLYQRMINKPCTGDRTKTDIDQQIRELRSEWGSDESIS